MTTPEQRREEFLQRCLEDGQNPGAVRLDTRPDRRQQARRHRNLAGYHRRAVEDHLTGQARLMAIEEGYYVMFHKTNQALALAGFKPNTHVCTQLGLRGIFNAPDLTNDLRRAYEERENVDYRMRPQDPTLGEFESPDSFVSETVTPFVDAVDSLIETELALPEDAWEQGVDPRDGWFE